MLRQTECCAGGLFCLCMEDGRAEAVDWDSGRQLQLDLVGGVC